MCDAISAGHACVHNDILGEPDDVWCPVIVDDVYVCLVVHFVHFDYEYSKAYAFDADHKHYCASRGAIAAHTRL